MPGAYIHAIYTLHSLAEIGNFFFKKEIEFGSLLANICFLHQHIIILIFNVMNVTLNYIHSNFVIIIIIIMLRYNRANMQLPRE